MSSYVIQPNVFEPDTHSHVEQEDLQGGYKLMRQNGRVSFYNSKLRPLQVVRMGS